MNNGKMSQYNLRFKQILLLLVAVAILLVACSQEEQPTPQSATQEQPTAQGAAQEKPTAQSTAQEKPTAQSTAQEKPTAQSEPQAAVTSPLASPLAAPQQVEPLPAPAGATGLAGVVVSNAYQPSKPLAATSVRLAVVDHKNDVFFLSGAQSPGTISKEDGRFLFTKVDPGDYVIVVGEVIGINEVFSKSDGKPYVFTVEKGKVTNVGVVTVSIQ